jgi:hypothetical protein
MSYHPITIDVLVNARRADLLLEAADESLAHQAMLAGGSRPWSLRDVLANFAAAFRHQELLSATSGGRDVSTSPA